MHSYLINEAEMEEKKAARLRAQADELETKLPPDGENNGVNRIFSLAITICYIVLALMASLLLLLSSITRGSR